MEPTLDAAAEQLLARMEAVDEAMATHLGQAFGDRRRIGADELRTAIVAWCRSAEARRRYDADLLDGAASAMGMMEDALLLPLVRDLLRQDRRRPRASAA